MKAVYLGDEDGECDVVDLEVGPGDVADKTLSTDPRLQTSSVQAAGDRDAVEVDVGDVGEFGLAFAKRTNRQTWEEVLARSCTTESGMSIKTATHHVSGNQWSSPRRRGYGHHR